LALFFGTWDSEINEDIDWFFKFSIYYSDKDNFYSPWFYGKTDN
jgi:hypothetical protein